MKNADDIKRFMEKASVSSNPKVNKDIFNELADEMEKTKQAGTSLNMWRIIMKSPITKLAVAACVIIAVIIGIIQFTGPINISTIALADISEAMKNVPWMHQFSKGFEGNVSGTAEQWFGFEAGIHASKWANGRVNFWNLKDERRYDYDPQNKTITILIQKNEPLIDLTSPASLLESMNKICKEQGAQIVTKEAKYDGQKVQLQEISLMHEGQSQTAKLYIQPDSKLLLAAQVKGMDAKGSVTMYGDVTFSYPQTGPSDIYDLGVPRDAKIIENPPE
jgi:hypothetical protein